MQDSSTAQPLLRHNILPHDISNVLARQPQAAAPVCAQASEQLAEQDAALNAFRQQADATVDAIKKDSQASVEAARQEAHQERMQRLSLTAEAEQQLAQQAARYEEALRASTIELERTAAALRQQAQGLPAVDVSPAEDFSEVRTRLPNSLLGTCAL